MLQFFISSDLKKNSGTFQTILGRKKNLSRNIHLFLKRYNFFQHFVLQLFLSKIPYIPSVSEQNTLYSKCF